MPMPAKPCGYCESLTHWPYQCYKNPYLKKFGWRGSKKYDAPISKSMKKHGTAWVKWERTRKAWFIENARDEYACYLCGRFLFPYEVTLDHIKARSSHPELRYVLENLAPCCYTCNSLKGSKSLENYKKGL